MDIDPMERRDYMVEQKLRELVEENEKRSMQRSVAEVYTVPDEYRIGKEKHFEPRNFSIGLLHAQNKKLMATKGIKRNYFLAFMQHLSSVGQTKEQLVQVLSKHAKSLVNFYDNAPEGLKNERADEFLEVLLLDSCFIVHLLLMVDWESISKGRLLMKADETLVITLQRDLLKFENQVPFSILVDLAQLAFPDPQVNSTRKLVEQALFFFEIKEAKTLVDGISSARHLLELLLLAHFPRPAAPSSAPFPTTNRSGADLPDIESVFNQARSASELENFGIKLRPKLTKNLADIEFKHGVLYIPRLEIDENFPSMAWNFLVFEQYREEGIFLSYVMLMDLLISSEADVKVLIRSRVLKVWFNDLQLVVSLFDELSTNLNAYWFRFTNIIHALNTHCESPLRTFRADFMRRYYANRWDMLNSVLLFILTVTQTLFSVLSYNPKDTLGRGKSH